MCAIIFAKKHGAETITAAPDKKFSHKLNDDLGAIQRFAWGEQGLSAEHFFPQLQHGHARVAEVFGFDAGIPG